MVNGDSDVCCERRIRSYTCINQTKYFLVFYVKYCIYMILPKCMRPSAHSTMHLDWGHYTDTLTQLSTAQIRSVAKINWQWWWWGGGCRTKISKPLGLQKLAFEPHPLNYKKKKKPTTFFLKLKVDLWQILGVVTTTPPPVWYRFK